MISVIVPVYNTEEYLPQCIESILQQDFRDFELILVNDGSVDSSYEICKRYEQKDSRIKVISQENSGQGAARNVGIMHSVGEFITFVDSDDWIFPKMLSTLYHNLLFYKADISCCLTFSDKFESDRKYEQECIVMNNQEAMRLFANNKNGFNHSPVAKLFKRSVVDKNRFLEIRGFEDAGTVFKFFVCAGTVVSQGVSLYFYYQRQNSTMHREFSKLDFNRIVAFKEMDDRLWEMGNYPEAAFAATKGRVGAIYHFAGELMNSQIPEKQEYLNKVQKESRLCISSGHCHKMKDVLLLILICVLPWLFGKLYMRKKSK